MRKSLADFEKQIGGLRSKLGNESFVARHRPRWSRSRARLAELESQRDAVADF